MSILNQRNSTLSYFAGYDHDMTSRNYLKIKFVLFCLVYTVFLQQSESQEQETPKYAVEAFTDNDAFTVWTNLDRYYTFGLGPKFYLKPQKFIGLEKLFSNKENYFFELGIRSEGYTPTKQSYDKTEILSDSLEFERPFAGLLFGSVGATYTFDRYVLKGELLVGIMGPSAFAREIQNWFHEQLPSSDEVQGWEFQIPDQAIVNINVRGAYDFFSAASWFDVYAAAEARLGNLYIDATPALGVRIGKFQALSKSTGFGNDLLAPLKVTEIFFKSSIAATFTAFNATAQGNLFKRDFEFEIKDLSHFHTTISNGIYVAFNRFSMRYDNIFTFGKVIKGVKHIYGRVEFRYRF